MCVQGIGGMILTWATNYLEKNCPFYPKQIHLHCLGIEHGIMQVIQIINKTEDGQYGRYNTELL